MAGDTAHAALQELDCIRTRKLFRIDHDEVFNQTTHLEYQPWRRGPWFGFNWRYDSGLVAGATPCLGATATCSPTTSTADGGANPNIPSGYVAMLNTITGAPLTADQEFQAGFTCNLGLHVMALCPHLLAHCPVRVWEPSSDRIR